MKEAKKSEVLKTSTKKKTFLIIICIAVGVLLLAGISYGAYQAIKLSQKPATPKDQNGPKKDNEKDTDQELIDLEAYKGNVWAAKIPQGWEVNETESGIDIYDPNDEMRTGVSSVAAIGWFGESSPDKFIAWALNQLGASNTNYLTESSEEIINEPLSGLPWTMKTKIFTFTDSRDRDIKAKAAAGVLNGYGQYIALMSAFQTTPDKWGKWALILERVAQSIVIINPSKVGGIDKVRLPTAADLANDSSPLMEAWEYRNQVGEKTSHEWSDAMLGQERDLVSPSTGQTYDRPLSAYDPTIGGYRNPDNSSEILHDPYAD